jgi:uncharacterized protein (UPF0297 family)
MATAKIVPTIVLELSEKEAEVLKSMVGNITGSGEIRDITNNIYLSLDDCGINAIDDLFTDVFKIKERK